MRKKFSIRIDEDTYQKIEAMAQDKFMPPAQMARYLIELGLSGLDGTQKRLLKMTLANCFYNERILAMLDTDPDNAKQKIQSIKAQAEHLTQEYLLRFTEK